MFPSSFRPFVAPPSEPATRPLWLFVLRGQFVHDETGAIPTRRPEVGTARHFLGFLDDVPLWAIELEGEPLGDEYRLVQLRQLYGSIPEPQWIMAGRAEQISTFDRTHRFLRPVRRSHRGPSDRPGPAVLGVRPHGVPAA